MNTNDKRINISGKLDFKPTKNTFLSLGGSFYARKSNDFSGWRSMFSWDENRNSSQTTYRLFGKLTQKFGTEESNSEESASTSSPAWTAATNVEKFSFETAVSTMFNSVLEGISTRLKNEYLKKLINIFYLIKMNGKNSLFVQ